MNSKEIIVTLVFYFKSVSERERDADFKAGEALRLSDMTSCILYYRNWVECNLDPKINSKTALKVSRIGQAAAFLAYGLVLIVTNLPPHRPAVIFQLHNCC